VTYFVTSLTMPDPWPTYAICVTYRKWCQRSLWWHQLIYDFTHITASNTAIDDVTN